MNLRFFVRICVPCFFRMSLNRRPCERDAVTLIRWPALVLQPTFVNRTVRFRLIPRGAEGLNPHLIRCWVSSGLIVTEPLPAELDPAGAPLLPGANVVAGFPSAAVEA